METYEQLEHEFSDFVGMNCGEMVACSSGTAALHLALEALELPLKSKVILSDFNMIACPRAITLAGLKPVFVDCNTDDLLLSPEPADFGANDPIVSAIMPVHIYGRQCDMEWINQIAARVSLSVIEDMSEIHGISPQETSDTACWSFYKNKIVAGEEGGIVWFKDPYRAKIARELRSLGFSDKHDFLHRPRGHNYRMSNCHAELVLKSLMRFSENMARRNQIEDGYNKYIPKQWQMPLRDAVWVYDLRIPDLGYSRMDAIVKELNGKGIAARHSFKPMTMQTEYQMSALENINAHKASQEVLYLPVYPSMTEREVKANAEALIEASERAFS